MIQSVVQTDFEAYVNTEANQIMIQAVGPPVIIDPYGYILYLVKFTNDYSGQVLYCYPTPQYLAPRYSKFDFTFNITPDMFNGEINLSLAGYYHYEFYEVWWKNKPPDILDKDLAPACELEDCILPEGDEHGIVKGLVAIGKMYVAEHPNKEQVQYDEYSAPTNTNYIYQGT